MSTGAVSNQWYDYRKDKEWRQVDGEVIDEALITIYVNGVEMVTLMGTPLEGDLLALGFMKNEGLIEEFFEIQILHVSKMGCCVDLWLDRPFEKPERTIITSGCGGGVTFIDPETGLEALRSEITLEPEVLHQAFRKLQTPYSLYSRSRGVHAAGLLDPQSGELLAVVEDVGRHNTIDKLTGCCLVNRIETVDRVLIATGRISSEMMRKAAVMGCPIVASRTSPTALSVKMARAWHITLAGYVRSGQMRVYSCPGRLGYSG
jgi:FdhD protein